MRAYRLAYDGVPYHGFQRQPDVPTVEDALFGALGRLGVHHENAEKPPGYAAAGRTDAGVSALAQTVAFEAPDWLTPRALNSELPADVRAWASADVPGGANADAPDDFHATHDAASRTYTYHLHAPDASEARAREAADRLEGTHDLHNLTSDDEGTERRIDEVAVERDGECASEHDGEYLVIRVEAPGFCRHQVRRLVTVLERVATGDRNPGYVSRVLATEPLTGPEGIPSAAPEPLALTGVEYPELEFTVDEEAAASAREIFEAKRIEHRTRARVARAISRGVE